MMKPSLPLSALVEILPNSPVHFVDIGLLYGQPQALCPTAVLTTYIPLRSVSSVSCSSPPTLMTQWAFSHTCKGPHSSATQRFYCIL